MAVSVANTSTVEETIASSGEPKLSATTPARRSSGGSLDDVERRGRCIVDAAPVALPDYTAGVVHVETALGPQLELRGTFSVKSTPTREMRPA